MPYQVSSKSHAPGSAPGGPPILIYRLEQDCVARLSIDPVVIEDISLYQDPLCVLDFKPIFDRPSGSGLLGPPLQGFAAVVSDEPDIRRDQSLDSRVGASKHHILAGSL